MARGEFKIQEFKNPSGQRVYRVYGWKLEGTGFDSRVRENFKTHGEAIARLQQLQIEAANTETAARPVVTRLTPEQAKIAEAVLHRLGPGGERELVPAVEYWIAHGRDLALRESPWLAKAIAEFKAWLDTTPILRERTKANLRLRVGVFGNSVPSLRVSDITPEVIEKYLEKRNASARTRINDRLALSRFFRFCIERPRRWVTTNPCREVHIEQNGDNAPPSILTLADCEKLLRAAETHRRGRLAPYVAMCLFGGLRPFEASRLTWGQVNLGDREIRLEGIQTKTKRARVVTVNDTLAAWLTAYKNKPFYPSNWRKDFDILKADAGFGNPERLTQKQRETVGELKPWPDDVMRHTAISHYFRITGSYGKTAEQFGNSEAIIKRHYQGRVSSEDTKAFYSLLPTKRTAKR